MVPTRGILLALGGVGLLVYYALQGARAEEEKQRIPQLEGRIGALEEQVAPWRALDENMPARIFREFSDAIESLYHEVQQVARYWGPLADPRWLFVTSRPYGQQLASLPRFTTGALSPRKSTSIGTRHGSYTSCSKTIKIC